MTMCSKLDDGSKHLLRLAMREADAEGWAKVSKVVWPAIVRIPDDLVEKRPSDDGGYCRLTVGGEAVINYT